MWRPKQREKEGEKQESGKSWSARAKGRSAPASRGCTGGGPLAPVSGGSCFSWGAGQSVQEAGGMLVALVDCPYGNGGIKGRRELIPVGLKV